MVERVDVQAVADGIGHGLLMFNGAGALVLHNRAAGALLGPDLRTLQREGWPALEALFGARLGEDAPDVATVRDTALRSPEPVRFHVYRSGEVLPCWLAAVNGERGEVFTLLTLDRADWSAVSGLLERFQQDMFDAVASTRGHLAIIQQGLGTTPEFADGALGKRVGGFLRLMDMQMTRTERALGQMRRLENIRNGTIASAVRTGRRRVPLLSFIEDTLEAFADQPLLDPETPPHDWRDRLLLDLPDGVALVGSPAHLRAVLRDLLRNAMMYSDVQVQVLLRAFTRGDRGETVQIDVADQGIGVRPQDAERVFAPFLRARQPKVLGEFGDGLALYLCKHEVEAMSGRLWYTSELGAGSVFSLALPRWADDATLDADHRTPPFILPPSSADTP